MSCRRTSTCCVVAWAALAAILPEGRARPNLVVIVADDLGYSDLGCFGGEIDTPNIDQLAEQGLRFTHFRATPMCSTSRVALMSGSPFARAGGLDYAHSAPLAAVLRSGGYRTMMVGKWHAGNPDPRSRELFDRSFGFLGGMTDCFGGGPDWFLDEKPFSDFGPDFFSTRAFADRGIEFLSEALASAEPFFLYMAFNAPHHPCQAPRQTYEKYVGRYSAGYEAIQNDRLARQISLGITPRGAAAAPRGAEARRWSELPEQRKVVEDARMAAYAAAVDELDQAVGRIVEFLRGSDQLDQTLLVFLSDNGADYNNGDLRTQDKQVPWLKGHNPTGSNGWAAVKNTPYRGYKHSCHEGGLASPLVMRWPTARGGAAGSIVATPCHITDLYPTLLAAADVSAPATYAGHAVVKPAGVSLLPLLTQGAPPPRHAVFCHYRYSRSWIEDEFKAVQHYGGPWQLFDLATDRAETVDLSRRVPRRLQRYVTQWRDFAGTPEAENQAPPPAPQRGWGWHRLKMISPNLVQVLPTNSSVTSSRDVDLHLEFDAPLDFAGAKGKSIRLYSASDEARPLWQATLDRASNAQGSRSISFTDLPRLQPDQGYFLTWDQGWVRVGGREIGALNDGAFWWRFRTPPESSAP